MSLENLLNGLKFYYKCDEGSGSRLDSSANALTVLQTGFVGSVAGALNLAINGTGNTSNFLEAANDVLYRIAGSFSFSGWIRVGTGTLTANHPLAALWANTDRGWLVFFQNSNDRISFGLGDPGGSSSTILSWTAGPVLDTFQHVYCEYDSGTGLMGISVDNATLVTQAFVGTPNPTSTATFNLFAFRGSSFIVGTEDVDEMAAWDRLLTTSERTTLFGGGTPPSFDSFGPSGVNEEDAEYNYYWSKRQEVF